MVQWWQAKDLDQQICVLLSFCALVYLLFVELWSHFVEKSRVMTGPPAFSLLHLMEHVAAIVVDIALFYSLFRNTDGGIAPLFLIFPVLHIIVFWFKRRYTGQIAMVYAPIPENQREIGGIILGDRKFLAVTEKDVRLETGAYVRIVDSFRKNKRRIYVVKILRPRKQRKGKAQGERRDAS